MIVWLNGPTADMQDSEEAVIDGGLLLFPEPFMECLRHTGISISPRVHPDFLSSMGNLNVNYSKLCPNSMSYVVPRRANRAVIVPSGIGFSFFTFENPESKPSSLPKELTFDADILNAMVYIFEA